MLKKFLLVILITFCTFGSSSVNAADQAMSSRTINTSNQIVAPKIQKSSNLPKVMITKYKITKMTYRFKGVDIKYPKLSGLNDKSKQNRINKIIRDRAIKDYKHDSEGSVEVDYDIKFKSDNLLSIAYEGLSFYKGAAHPNKLFWTTNIDLNKCNIIRLRDILLIDGNLFDRFKKGKCLWGLLGKDIVNSLYDNKQLLDDFKGADNPDDLYSETYSYLTPNSLGISVSVCFAAGGHQEVEISYKDLVSNIMFSNDVWDNFKGLVEPIKNQKDPRRINTNDVRNLLGNHNFVELTSDEIWNKMHGQIFAYNEDSTGYSYFVKNRKVTLLCKVHGDFYGVQETFVTDLDHNGDPELIFDCDYDSGPYYNGIYGYRDGDKHPSKVISAPYNEKYLVQEIEGRIIVLYFDHQQSDEKPQKVGEIQLSKVSGKNNEFKFVKTK